MTPIWAVGLATRTVLDGNIDVALIETDGETIADFAAYRRSRYPQWIRSLLEETVEAAHAWNFGGHGAPLAAAYHAAQLRAAGATGDMAVLNLSDVAKLIWWDGFDRFVAFDAGPADALLDDFVESCGLAEMDRDSALCRAGTVDEARLTRLLQHPYLSAPYPKSLGRFDFGAGMAEGLGPEDGAALMAAFMASAVGRALDLLPQWPTKLLVSGGRGSSIFMDMLASRANVEIAPAEACGSSGDAVEAECFAYLAVRVLRGLLISFPSTTGVPQPMTGGIVVG